MEQPINLHLESLYLQGARDLLLRLEQQQATITWHHGKDSNVYDKAVVDKILHDRDSLVKFLQGSGWRYYDHQKNKKGKLTSLKIEFI